MDPSNHLRETAGLHPASHAHAWKAVGLVQQQRSTGIAGANGAIAIEMKAAVAQSCECGEVRAVWLPDPEDIP
jgi:hypothetical protein